MYRKLVAVAAVSGVLLAGCGGGQARSVTIDSSCVNQVTTGTAMNPTKLYEIVEVDVQGTTGTTGTQMAVKPGGKTSFMVSGCGKTTPKVVESTKVRLQPGAPALP